MACGEWGGCVPVDSMAKSIPWFDGCDVASLNSGRAAILAAVKDMGAYRVLLPYYLCPTVRDFLVAHGLAVSEYHIDEKFMPLIDGLAQDEAIVWSNWLGCMALDVKKEVRKTFGTRLIIDNCHAFFEMPILDSYNVYSCRKFFGVPSGAYLVKGRFNAEMSFHYDAQAASFDFLHTAFFRGSDAVLDSYTRNESNLAERAYIMDPIVKLAVAGTDFEKVKAARMRNLTIIDRRLGSCFPGMDTRSGFPIWYPFYYENDDLRDLLLASKVFVPRLWKRVLSMESATRQELRLARYLFPLPIDQRYSVSDSEQLADLVLSCMQKANR